MLARIKRFVPLSIKVKAHELNALRKENYVRLVNRLHGGSPIPPGRLIFLVAGNRRPDWFVASGVSSARTIREAAERAGRPMESCNAILDFGCGVGRIMRHFADLKGLHGTDYNPDPIAWCRQHLSFADFQVNTLAGGLPYPSEKFDLVYSYSVFTHLGEELQHFWMKEMFRVLKPGGLLYLTLHGEKFASGLNAEYQAAFRAGQFVVTADEREGENFCAAYHPETYVREVLAKDFEVLEFVPCCSQGGSDQDAYMLRKPVAAVTSVVSQTT
jgi:SAM-dependent methyltransferase